MDSPFCLGLGVATTLSLLNANASNSITRQASESTTTPIITGKYCISVRIFPFSPTAYFTPSLISVAPVQVSSATLFAYANEAIKMTGVPPMPAPIERKTESLVRSFSSVVTTDASPPYGI